MKKLAVIVLLGICLLSLCCCYVDASPFATQSLTAQKPRVFEVYVCGAVKNEGYVRISEGTSYQNLILSAGYIPQTVFVSTPYAVVGSDVSCVILRYYNGAMQCDCVNVNGALVTDRCEVENISSAVIDKIADYIGLYGKITDKSLLEQILGEDYADNYYKFFVSESDYEKIC